MWDCSTWSDLHTYCTNMRVSLATLLQTTRHSHKSSVAWYAGVVRATARTRHSADAEIDALICELREKLAVGRRWKCCSRTNSRYELLSQLADQCVDLSIARVKLTRCVRLA